MEPARSRLPLARRAAAAVLGVATLRPWILTALMLAAAVLGLMPGIDE